MTFADSKDRFSTRVADYLRYRPGYPSGVRDILRAECNLKSGHAVADIGSGTGFLSEVFLKNGNHVFGVEPNEAMRQAGEEYLASYDGFTSINGSAESTTLDDSSVDFVTTGQAFHWFDQNASRKEFTRVLKPAGWVVVIWNERLTDTTPFLRDYEALLREFGTDYARVKESYPTEQHMRDFFGAGVYSSHELPNFQEFDFDILDTTLIDEVIRIANETAFRTAREAAKIEGLPVGISAGAAIAAALELGARPDMAGKMIVTILPSFAERYLSTALFEGM